MIDLLIGPRFFILLCSIYRRNRLVAQVSISLLSLLSGVTLMFSIKKACSSRTHPRLHFGGLILKNSSTSPLLRLIPQAYSTSAHNYLTSLPPLIKLCFTFKKFKSFINTRTSSMNLYKWIQTLTFIHGLGLRPKPLLDPAKF